MCNISYDKYEREAYMLIKLTLQIPLHSGLHPCYISVVVYELVIHYKCTSQQSMPAEFRYKWQRSQTSADLSARGQDQEEGEGFYISILTTCHKSRNWKTTPLLSSQLLKYFNSGRHFPVILINIPGLNKDQVHTHEESVKAIPSPLPLFFAPLLTHNIHETHIWRMMFDDCLYLKLIPNKQNAAKTNTPSNKPQACSFQAGWINLFKSETQPMSCEITPISSATHCHKQGKEHRSQQPKSFGCAKNSELLFLRIIFMGNLDIIIYI